MTTPLGFGRLLKPFEAPTAKPGKASDDGQSGDSPGQS
jgi:hypothetical protein